MWGDRGDTAALSSDITILHREVSVEYSTFFNEILTCRLADGCARRLLLKRGGTRDQSSHGHHGGVPYEAEVYRSVLKPLGTSAPRFYAAYEDHTKAETVLLIEYLENATPFVDKVDLPTLRETAHWIGSFQRLNEPRVSALATSLIRYDAPYYLGWMQRTLEFAPEECNPWLSKMSGHWEALIDELLAAPATVIHGEFYPSNILVQGETISPVDWETAAIAAGEIDLVSLTEKWPDDDKRACEIEYCSARWSGGTSLEFERRLAIAQIYLHLRWLGDRREWTRDNDNVLRFEDLYRVSKRLGLIE